MSKQKKKVYNDFGGIMFSTNPDFEFAEEQFQQEETLPNAQQNLRILLDRKNRAGKTATVITGYIGKDEDLQVLGKTLKTRCGVGGSVKDREIIIQGDFRDKILQYLTDQGYKVKKSGG
ncbi:translation initiation factor [Pedobacter sp.]|uniref:translation initiation factor n=1 Tax=Pedobacter sp. TaxID=1411316 RepID=UPI00396C3495